MEGLVYQQHNSYQGLLTISHFGIDTIAGTIIGIAVGVVLISFLKNL